MERRLFASMKHEVAVIGQGSWYLDSGNRAFAIAALRQGLDLGMTHIDAAEFYGVVEDVVGEAIAERRDEVFLVSKVIPGNASRSGTIAACERSLASEPTGWIATSCTGEVSTRWKTRSRPSTSSSARARSSPGA